MIVLGSPELAKLSTRQDTILKVEEALLIQERGNFLLPERMHVHKDSDTLLLMPCFGRDYFITKLVSVYPGNINLSKPAVYGTLILNDNKTGEPLALMNASQVTSARTGALGAVAAKYWWLRTKSDLE